MADVEAPSGGGGGGNVFTRKLGPLPMWAWMSIALLVAVFYYLYKKNQSGSTGSGTGASSGGAAANTPGGVDASLVPQFVNQTYTTVEPPTAPNVTVNNNTPSPTGTAPPPSTTPLNEILTAGHTINPSAKKAEIGWTIKQQSPNATQLQVVLNGPGAKNQTRYIPASATTATFDNLQPGHTYVADVTPVDAQGQAVGGPNHVTFVTAKS